MTPLLLWGYRAGIALFLGSILTFVVSSSLATGADLDDLVFARRLIRRATLAVTVPGLWLAALSLAALAWRGGVAAWHLAAVAAVLATSHAVVVPATRSCLEWALESKGAGRLNPAFRAAYLRESIVGGINLLVVFALLVQR
jgi:hypothetical protein